MRGGPQVVSPQIEPDGRVTFRILAPTATSVAVGGDINGSLVPDPSAKPAPDPAPAAAPAAAPGAAAQRGGFPAIAPAVTMTKGENGVWSGTTARAVKPGAWRYTFNVDGVSVADPRNVKLSPNQTQPQSLLVVAGDFSETRESPGGHEWANWRLYLNEVAPKLFR